MHNIDFQPVLNWYSQNARTLPWRASRDPYTVWVSEIMLQQTTVATVIPYFQKFIAKWPTVKELALAELEDVLHIWQGLGYYRRAKHLHTSAGLINQNGWPGSIKELQKLPGIGSYTSRAIAAIAWNVSTLPVDGNIARVMARVTALKGIKNNIVKQLEQHDWGQIPEPGHVAQALMDLGQAVCTPRDPLCERCPLQSQCRSPGDQPFIAPPTLQRQLYSQAICAADPNGLLLCEKANQSAPSQNLLEGLWGPLMAPWREKPYETKDLQTPEQVSYCGSFTHIFSHIRLTVDVYKSHHESINMPHLPFSRLAHKILKKAGCG